MLDARLVECDRAVSCVPWRIPLRCRLSAFGRLSSPSGGNPTGRRAELSPRLALAFRVNGSLDDRTSPRSNLHVRCRGSDAVGVPKCGAMHWPTWTYGRVRQAFRLSCSSRTSGWCVCNVVSVARIARVPAPVAGCGRPCDGNRWRVLAEAAQSRSTTALHASQGAISGGGCPVSRSD